jgi:hypothetical protein
MKFYFKVYWISVSCVIIMIYCLYYLFSSNCLRPNKLMMSNKVINELMIRVHKQID